MNGEQMTDSIMALTKAQQLRARLADTKPVRRMGEQNAAAVRNALEAGQAIVATKRHKINGNIYEPGAEIQEIQFTDRIEKMAYSGLITPETVWITGLEYQALREKVRSLNDSEDTLRRRLTDRLTAEQALALARIAVSANERALASAISEEDQATGELLRLVE